MGESLVRFSSLFIYMNKFQVCFVLSGIVAFTVNPILL